MRLLKNAVLKIFILLFLTSVNYPQSDDNLFLMPVPREIKINQGKFRLTKDFLVGINGNPDNRIYPAATRFLKRLNYRTANFFSQGIITKENNPVQSDLIISIEKPGEIKLGENESYKLIVTEGSISIQAPNDIGAMYGMETLLQLLSIDEKGYYFPAVKIDDSPRFKWRGLMLDVSRHFMPVDLIKRNLDAMASAKMNVFHWHLSDDQGFRIESKTFPKLHVLGSDGFYYLQSEVKEIIKYAADRGIRVIPEFDIPGHATSWFVGYPEYASAPGPYQIERSFGIFDPTFNPAEEKTYEFFDHFFQEICSLFPDPYLHIGGDENNGKHWNMNEEIKRFKDKKGIKDNSELQAYFNTRIQSILKKYGKSMIGWDEIFHPGIPKDIVIQSWRGKKALISSAKQGYQGILSNGYYIDLMQKTDFHYLNDPVEENSGLTQEEESRILGGEATMWSELVTPENVDSRIWPRTAAIAERFWSPKEIRDVEDMYKRLKRVSFLLEEHGLTHISFQEMMLRRLTNNQSTDAVKIFIDVIAPLGEYQRYPAAAKEGFSYKQYSPFSRISDAAIADPPAARYFNNAVTRFLKDRDQEAEKIIEHCLLKWKSNHDNIVTVIKSSPILKEIEKLSSNFSRSADTALQALEMINKKNKTSDEWKSSALNIINDARTSYAQVEIKVLDAFQKIIEAVD